LSSIYRWAYIDNRNAQLLDREFIVRSILWWQHNKLQQAAFKEITPGSKVLQAACVYGTFSKNLAEHIGGQGHLKIVDVVDFQVKNGRRKLTGLAHAEVIQGDVRNITDTNLDAVCCYFLLHEVPDSCKEEIIAVLLNTVRPGGKVVFIDYHKPHWAHPIKPITHLVFETLEPFAKALWHNEIIEFAHFDNRFSWEKETFFGGLFQKVVATRY
jgi:ubiquinone/menaquinone biosynthesis C-methylase UbiE